jgi:hypothetical protein
MNGGLASAAQILNFGIIPNYYNLGKSGDKKDKKRDKKERKEASVSDSDG